MKKQMVMLELQPAEIHEIAEKIYENDGGWDRYEYTKRYKTLDPTSEPPEIMGPLVFNKAFAESLKRRLKDEGRVVIITVKPID